MRVRLLGTAAGGGFPQWNCDCRNCRAARDGDGRARPRLQNCVAIGDDEGGHWFLVGASPDVREQVEALPRRRVGPARGDVVEGILLPSADLDQALGLFVLREGSALRVHATPAVRRSLSESLRLDDVLGAYCGVDWVPLAVDGAMPLALADGRPSGLTCRAFALPGKPPRYRERAGRADPLDAVGFRVVDEATGGRLVVAPGLAALDEATLGELADGDALLVDGTFWGEHELLEAAPGGRSGSASSMGHLPVGGPGGSLARLARLPAARKVFIHLNNTNPMLLEDSPERRRAEAAGFEVGCDGLEFRL